jgi:3-oxoacyl-[acyl-carrier-protein] synthase II
MTSLESAVTISGVGVLSPAGIGFDRFKDALRDGVARPCAAEALAFAGEQLPAAPARVVPGFDVREFLGPKNVAALDRTTQLAIVATGLALKDARLQVTPEVQRTLGVVLGSTAGGIRSIADFTRSTYTSNPPYMVSAVHFPNTVMNCAAGQCAIWHKLKGINSTVCAGRLSGLLALRYASLMLRLGRASALVTGAVEEYCDFTAWAKQALAPSPQHPALGEGCAMFVLARGRASEGGAVRGELLASHVAAAPAFETSPSAFGGALRACVVGACERAGVAPGDVAWWSAQRAGPAALDGCEREAVLRALHGRQPAEIAAAEVMGDTFGAGSAFALAALLASAAPGLGLVTGLAAEGMVGCAVVRVGGGDA